MLPFEDAPRPVHQRDVILARLQQRAGEDFMRRACEHVLMLLAVRPTSGERLTEMCKLAGIVPPNGDRAFGAVYSSLAKKGLIQKVGTCLREKGNGTSGGNIWGLR